MVGDGKGTAAVVSVDCFGSVAAVAHVDPCADG